MSKPRPALPRAIKAKAGRMKHEGDTESQRSTFHELMNFATPAMFLFPGCQLPSSWACVGGWQMW